MFIYYKDTVIESFFSGEIAAETNQINKQIIKDFYEYLQRIDTSENYQNGPLKVLIRYAEYIGKNLTFYQIQQKEQRIL